MFGLGGQEILILGMCCGFPVVAAVVALVVLASRRSRRDVPFDDDEDFDDRSTTDRR